MNKKIWLKIKCEKYYKLIKKINNLEVSLYEIKSVDDVIYLKTDLKSYEKLKKYLISYEFDFFSYCGIKKIESNILNNKLTFLISILGIIALFILNNVVVEIEILHESETLRNILETELNSYNVKPLTFKKDYETLNEIKDKILNDYKDEIDWIEIETVGMKYVVKVEERIINDIIETEEYCNVYATSDGMITEVNVETGVLVVSLGDFVKEGDLLISGDIMLNEENKGKVCASGVVKAEKWYETTVKVPLEYFEDTKTGTSRYNLVLEHDNKKTRLLNSRIENFESNYTTLFDLLGFKLYLEEQNEVTRNYLNYTEEEAINKALEMANSTMLVKLSEEESIIFKKVLKKSEINSTIEVDIFMITEEVVS